MNNKSVALAFLDKRTAEGSNFRSNGCTLFSYGTAIAVWYDETTLIVNHTDYSATTKKHQYHLMRALNSNKGVKIIDLMSDVQRGTTDLISEYKRRI